MPVKADKQTSIVTKVIREAFLFPRHIHEGRAQQSLGFIAGMSSFLGGLEVAYEHYRGSYGQKIMYTPVIFSVLGTGACLWGVVNSTISRTLMPAISLALLADGVLGFFFHIRGVARKPGGWRIPAINITMGPPLFAPLLLGIGGYLGVIASFMRREDRKDGTVRYHDVLKREIATGHFQKHMAVVSGIAALLSGAEALYSHYKNNFRYKVRQWSPILLAPVLFAVAIYAVVNPKAARKILPAVSLLAILDGTIGFLYHCRGVKRRPGGLKHPVYNVIYGPPVFAPLLFAAAGFLGILASIMKREEK